MKKSCLNGHGIVEYTLIGVLVLGLCTIGLSRLGFILQGDFDAFQRSLARGQPVSPSMQITSSGDGSSTGDSANSSSMEDRYWMGPEQTSSSIQVMGVNGATKELVSALENRVRGLLESGKITEGQANLLHKLANRGHDMAKAQQAVEDAITNTQTTVMFEGKEYSLWDLGGSMGVGVGSGESQQKVDEMMAQTNNAIMVNGKRYDASLMANGTGLSINADGTDWDLNPMFASYAAKPFFQAYQEAKQSGALSDPQVSAGINTLVLQIATLGDSFAQGMQYLEGIPSDRWAETRQSFNNYTAQSFQNNLSMVPIDFTLPADIATETHEKSGQICKVGAGMDDGLQCKSN